VQLTWLQDSSRGNELFHLGWLPRALLKVVLSRIWKSDELQAICKVGDFLQILNDCNTCVLVRNASKSNGTHASSPCRSQIWKLGSKMWRSMLMWYSEFHCSHSYVWLCSKEVPQRQHVLRLFSLHAPTASSALLSWLALPRISIHMNITDCRTENTLKHLASIALIAGYNAKDCPKSKRQCYAECM